MELNRRGFLGSLIAGVAGIALEQAIPFGRVWSFPKEIVIADSILLPPNSTVRIIEIWDWRRGLVQRLDLAGSSFALIDRSPFDEKCRMIRMPRGGKLLASHVPEVPKDSFRLLARVLDGQLKHDQIYGVTSSIPSSPLES